MIVPPQRCECGYPAEMRPLVPLFDGDDIRWRCTACLRGLLEDA